MSTTAQGSAEGVATVNSRIFGSVEVSADQRVTLPDGLIGFPACHDFALIPAGPRGFTWLQSMEHETLALLLVDPFLYYPEYSIDLPAPVVNRLGALESADVSVQTVVTLGDEKYGPTANLQGPVLLNVKKRRGYQFVLQNAPFGTREPLVTDGISG